MKNLKRLTVLGSAVMIMGATTLTALAATTYSTPAEAVAGLTGRTTESVIAQRQETSKSYGSIANEADKLEEFKEETLQIKKNILEARVEDGTMTQEEANTLLATIENKQESCDGTGSGSRLGSGMGAGFGQNSNKGNSLGNGMGNGTGCKGGNSETL